MTAENSAVAFSLARMEGVVITTPWPMFALRGAPIANVLLRTEVTSVVRTTGVP